MPKYGAFGWRPDKPDQRDRLYFAEDHVDLATLPPRVDLSPGMPFPPFNQLELGSCTGQAISAHLSFNRKRQGLRLFIPSRLFIYYNEREIEGTINEDAGAELRDGIKSISELGACSEDDWPHDISQFTIRPSDKAYANAMLHKAVKYQRVRQKLPQMKGCLASGFPFLFGFSVYDSFEGDEVARTGMVPMPMFKEELLGGHAVVGMGYDDNSERFKVLNSWGPDWGNKGYFYIPYDYLANSDLAADFWTIRLVL